MTSSSVCEKVHSHGRQEERITHAHLHTHNASWAGDCSVLVGLAHDKWHRHFGITIDQLSAVDQAKIKAFDEGWDLGMQHAFKQLEAGDKVLLDRTLWTSTLAKLQEQLAALGLALEQPGEIH
jgi:hypothetical protein